MTHFHLTNSTPHDIIRVQRIEYRRFIINDFLKKFDQLADYTIKRAVALAVAVTLLLVASFVMVESSALGNAHATELTEANVLTPENPAQEGQEGDTQEGGVQEDGTQQGEGAVDDSSVQVHSPDETDMTGSDMDSTEAQDGQDGVDETQVHPQDIPVLPQIGTPSYSLQSQSVTIPNHQVKSLVFSFTMEESDSWCISSNSEGADCVGGSPRALSDCDASEGSLTAVGGDLLGLSVTAPNLPQNTDITLYAFSCTEIGGDGLRSWSIASAIPDGGLNDLFPIKINTLQYDINGGAGWSFPPAAFGMLYYLSGEHVTDPATPVNTTDIGDFIGRESTTPIDVWCSVPLNPIAAGEDNNATRGAIKTACESAGGESYKAGDYTIDPMPSTEVEVTQNTVLYATYAWNPSAHKMFVLHARNGTSDVPYLMVNGPGYVDWADGDTDFPTFPVPTAPSGYHFGGWSSDVLGDEVLPSVTTCPNLRSDAAGVSTLNKQNWQSAYSAGVVVPLYACYIANNPATPGAMTISMDDHFVNRLTFTADLVDPGAYSKTDLTYTLYMCDFTETECSYEGEVSPEEADETVEINVDDVLLDQYTESLFKLIVSDPESRESDASYLIVASLPSVFAYPNEREITGWSIAYVLPQNLGGTPVQIPLFAPAFGELSPAGAVPLHSEFTNWHCTYDESCTDVSIGKNMIDYLLETSEMAPTFKAHFYRNAIDQSWFNVTPASWNAKHDGIIALQNEAIPAGLMFSDFEIANRGSYNSCGDVPGESYSTAVSANLIDNVSGNGAHYCVRLKAQDDDYKVIDASAPVDINVPAGAPLNVTVADITANDKVYDGTTSATAGFVSAKVVCDGMKNDNDGDTICYDGDDVTTLSGNSRNDVHVNYDNYVATFGNPNAGDRTVGIGGLALSGTDTSYYHLTDTPITTTATISKKPIELYAYDVTVVENDAYSADHLGVYSSGFVPVDAGVVQPLTGSLKLGDDAYRTADLTPGDTYPSACNVASSAPTYQYGCIIEDAAYTYDNYEVSTFHPGALIVVPNADLADLIGRYRKLILHLDNPAISIVNALNEPLAEAVDFIYCFDDVIADQYNRDWLVAHDAEDNQLLEGVDAFEAEIRASNLHDLSTRAVAEPSAQLPWNAKLVADEFGQDAPEYAALDAEIGDDHKLAQLWDIRFETLTASTSANYAAGETAPHGHSNTLQPGFPVALTTPSVVDAGASHKLWHKHGQESALEHAFTRDGANLKFTTDRFSLFGVSLTSNAAIKLPDTGLDAVKQLLLSVIVLLSFAYILRRRQRNSSTLVAL